MCKIDVIFLKKRGILVISMVFTRGCDDLKRNIMQDLIAWKQDKNRKPLILQGARQVGKTWIMQEFGKTQYQEYV